jgi:hypothetical protein
MKVHLKTTIDDKKYARALTNCEEGIMNMKSNKILESVQLIVKKGL